MSPHEAAAALEGVDRAEEKLAERARWPLHRHAMFGLCEGLLIAGLAQPLLVTAVMFGAAMFLLVACISGDRRRHGMFVSGWQKGATRPLMFVLVAFLATMVYFAIHVRSGDELEPLGLAIGLATFVVCTVSSIAWELIYRSELLGKNRP